MMEALTIFITIYIVSSLGVLLTFYTGKKYSGGGVNLGELIVLVITSVLPYVNTVISLTCLILFIFKNIDFNREIIKPWKKDQ